MLRDTFLSNNRQIIHDDVSKWKHFPRYWPFVRGIHRSPVNSPHKGQWRWALMFSFICAWINGWVNNREAGDLRLHRAHDGVIVMLPSVRAVQGSVSGQTWHIAAIFLSYLTLLTHNTLYQPIARPASQSLDIFDTPLTVLHNSAAVYMLSWKGRSAWGNH